MLQQTVRIVKVISWNLLRRVGASVQDVALLISREQPDLLLMQEATRDVDELPARIGGHYARTPLPANSHGLAVWSRSPISFRVMDLPPGTLIRRVCQIVDLGDFAVANVHLSHGQVLNRRQLRRIARVLPPRAAILGDFNLVGPALLAGFRDVGPRQPTHIMGDIVPIRIDRCLARDITCTRARALSRETSDHSPILVDLDIAAAGVALAAAA
ncbi:MAG TPA: endonuclease/exonuclease/phosphatase family protein [Acetobacteraceae bacterium]|nr:endonuclease/exonuclease/phosphatase family protein [Acetobacteraceae bacterium]